MSSASGITQFLMSVRVEGAHAEPRGDASFVRSRSRVVGGTQSGASVDTILSKTILLLQQRFLFPVRVVDFVILIVTVTSV